jgi:RNA recognition motif-containing protein
MTKMFVGGLPLNVCEADLEHYFQQWRAVDRCSVIVNPQTGRSRGFGFVTFYDEESINYVLQFNHYIGGKHVFCFNSMLFENILTGQVEVKVAKPNTQDKEKEITHAAVPQSPSPTSPQLNVCAFIRFFPFFFSLSFFLFFSEFCRHLSFVGGK